MSPEQAAGEKDPDGRSDLYALGCVRYEMLVGEPPHSGRARSTGARGDTAVATGLYQGFDESWSPWDMYHRPIAYQRLGEIAEAQGRATDAIAYYSRLLDLWRDCAAAVVPRRDEIQKRRDALVASRG